MYAHKIVAVAISALTVASAAGNATYTIVPSSVVLATRASWCVSERNVCGDLCTPKTNDCDPSTLVYSCICSDGTEPDMNEYANSLPFYECQQTFDNCISTNVGSATGQANCTTSIKDNCGTKNATSLSTTTTAASSGSTGTATAASTASSGTAASSSSSHAGAMPTSVQQFGNGAVAVAALLAMAL